MSKYNSVRRNTIITQCIFCGAKNPTSEEHIVAAWIFKFLEDKKIAYDRNSAYQNVLPNGTITQSLIAKTNDATSPILCQNCNGSWGSGIQNKVKLILKPFIAGKWNQLNNVEINRVLRWYTCHLMVREMLHDNHDTHTQFQRESFRGGGSKFPSTLNVWVASTTKATVESNHLIFFEEGLLLPRIPFHLAMQATGYFLFFSFGANECGALGINSAYYQSLCNLMDKLGFVKLLSFNRKVSTSFPSKSPMPYKFTKSIDLMETIIEGVTDGMDKYIQHK